MDLMTPLVLPEIIISAIFLVANLIIDLLYVLVDPRVKATFTKGKKAKQIDLDVYDDEENDSGADAAAFYIENEDEILERSKAV